MSLHYTVFPIDIGDQVGQYVVPEADVEPALPPAPDKYFRELWVLQGDSTSLRGKNGNRLIIGTAALTWFSNYVSIAGGSAQYGPTMPWPDTVEGTTMWIARRPASGTQQIIGGSQTNDGAAGGSSVFWDASDNIEASSRGIGASSMVPDGGLAVGDFFAVIMSHNADGRWSCISGGSPLFTAGLKIEATSDRANGLGNSGYPGTPFNVPGIDIAGCVDWDHYKDDNECLDLIGQYVRYFAALPNPVDIFH